MKIELLWFEDCPNHEAAVRMVREVLEETGVTADLARVEVPDLETGNRVTFPGSPTIRVDGRDIEPGWEECADCTPRCRLYTTADGLRGPPERHWLVAAVHGAA